MVTTSVYFKRDLGGGREARSDACLKVRECARLFDARGAPVRAGLVSAQYVRGPQGVLGRLQRARRRRARQFAARARRVSVFGCQTAAAKFIVMLERHGCLRQGSRVLTDALSSFLQWNDEGIAANAKTVGLPAAETIELVNRTLC